MLKDGGKRKHLLVLPIVILAAAVLVVSCGSGGGGAPAGFPGGLAIELVSKSSDGTPGNNDSYEPSISSDGRSVTFQSNSTNLVSVDTNGVEDVFVAPVK